MNAELPTSGLGELLASLRTHTEASQPHKTPLPAPPGVELHEIASSEDLPALFAAVAQQVGCQVWRATQQTWIGTCLEILRGLSAQTVLIEAQPGTALSPERCRELSDAVAGEKIRVHTVPDDDTLFTVDVGITGVRGAIAETGTLVCVSGESSARGASLIPLVHIAVVEESQILADLFDFFDQLGGAEHAGELPANINLITGPSKTADIEGVLVTGMHGPGFVHVILLGS